MSDTVTLSFLAEGPMVMRIGLQTISGNHHASHVLLRLVTRLRHPQHIGGIWSGLMPYTFCGLCFFSGARKKVIFFTAFPPLSGTQFFSQLKCSDYSRTNFLLFAGARVLDTH